MEKIYVYETEDGTIDFSVFKPEGRYIELDSFPECPFQNDSEHTVTWHANFETGEVWYTVVIQSPPSPFETVLGQLQNMSFQMNRIEEAVQGGGSSSSEYKDKYTTLVGEDFLDASPVELRCNIQSLITTNTANGTLLINVEPFIDEWVAGTMSQPVEHAVSDVARYQDQVYVCKQTHTHHGEPGWDPATYHAGWVLKHTKDASNPKPFVAESHNPYMKDEVALAADGFVYKSLIDNNVWEPTSYPQGWQKVEKELQ